MINKKKVDYTLYLCTDRDLMTTKTLEEAVELAIKGGCSVIQLREKRCTSREFFETALKIKKITNYYNVPLIINDRVDIAMLADADGVHLGQKDLPACEVRNILGDKKIIGVSTANTEEAIKAQKDGADYIGVGAMFQTSTKSDTRAVTKDIFENIKKNVSIPIVAIGGINKSNVSQIKGTGIAVVSAVIAQKDIESSARQLRGIISEKKICHTLDVM